MKTFKDLKHDEHSLPGHTQAKMFFDNGYGISVVFGEHLYSNGIDTYELAVLAGNKDIWALCYDTPVTNDVLGWLSKDEVSEAMKQVQELPKR